MSDIIAWIDIALGVLIGAVNLIKLTASRSKPEMDEPRARRNAWANLGAGLLIMAAGIAALGWGTKNDVAEWVARSAIFVIVGFTFFLWLKPRISG
jgi:hypothetical protein